jgi:hypothetical protein
MQHVEQLQRNDREIGGYCQGVSGQRFGKDIPAVAGMNTTIEELCFLFGPCRGVISKDKVRA